MTADQIRARRARLKRQVEQLNAEVNAILGAIQECDFWLAELAKPTPEAEAKPTAPVALVKD